MRLAQVVSNLLTNAAKYTEPGGQIWLTAEREGQMAVIRVRDDGIGISPDILPHIFELFVQADHGVHAVARGTRHWPHAGEEPCGNAQRHGRGPESRARQGERVSRAAAGLRSTVSTSNGARTRSRHPKFPRPRACGFWLWTTIRTPLTASPICSGCKDTRSGWLTQVWRPWR